MIAPIVVVVAIPGREELTRRTIEKLDEVGGGGDFEGLKVFSWTSPAPAPRFDGWETLHLRHAPRGGKLDVWEALWRLPTGDLIMFEDDVDPCRNVIPYMARWETPTGAAFTTFYNGRRLAPGLQPAMAPDGRGFWFSQALKLPSEFVDRCKAADENTITSSPAQDVAFGAVAHRLRLGVWYHAPSLVQHIGERSVGVGGGRLTGKRAPAPDFPGVDFDALSVVRR